jgi:uncharacterized protein (DUF362 family)
MAHPLTHSLTRRELVAGALAAGALTSSCHSAGRPQARVSITKVPVYGQSIYATVREILSAHRVDVKGKRVVVKPNLVEFDPASCINSNPIVVHAVFEAVKALGAAEVRIAEGPGHRRGTLDLADAAGYFHTVPEFEKSFVDLNLDRVSRVRLRNPASKLSELYLPNTALGADLLISVPKMKTHHWVGATLSMKNLFGLVPGAVYGWPKNVLHWAGIPECILDLNHVFAKTFAVVDGILGMEGNGPIQGKVKAAGVIVAGADLPAVDATCCRIMGIDSSKIAYLGIPATAQQIGESIEAVATRFELIPEFGYLRL